MDPDESLNVSAITRTGLDVVINGWDVPDDTDADCRTAVSDAIDEYFLSKAPWLLGLDFLPRTNMAIAAELGGVVSGIVAAHGGTITGVEMQPAGGGTPIETYVLGEGEKLKLNNETIYPAV